MIPAVADQTTKVMFQRPSLPPVEAIAEYFSLAEDANWYSNFGPCNELLAERLSAFAEADMHCVLVSSGTTGLIAALQALATTADGRDEVLVPSYTFIASVSAITWCGLRPIFVDVDPDHWSPSESTISEALEQRGDRVAAVLACTTFGTPPPPDVASGWKSACDDAGVPLVVDSAPGFGSIDAAGSPLAGGGDAHVVSFHATKPFAIGEGGAVFTRSVDTADRIRTLINFGLRDRRVVEHPGINGKMSELHAAVGLAVLDGFDGVLEARRANAARITRAALEHGYSVQAGHERSTFQFVPVLAPDGDFRAKLLSEACDRSIQLRTYHEPLHQADSLCHCESVGDLQVTQDLGERSVSLPMSNDMTGEELDAICGLLSEVVISDPVGVRSV